MVPDLRNFVLLEKYKDKPYNVVINTVTQTVQCGYYRKSKSVRAGVERTQRRINISTLEILTRVGDSKGKLRKEGKGREETSLFKPKETVYRKN